MTAIKDIRLEGKCALITGSARGLGKVMARALTSAGAKVAVVDIDEAEAQKTAAELTALGGGEAVAFRCDISSMEDAKRTIDAVTARFGRLDILVNNAAMGQIHIARSPESKSTKFYEADPKVWQQVVVVNVNGAFYMSYFAAPHMIKNGWGRIINTTTSRRSLQAEANSPYGVSKAAIESETQIFAKDLKGTGVTVNTILPGGAADTTFVFKSGAAGRPLLSPEVMFNPIIWLASEHSDGVTGERVVGMLWDETLDVNAAAKKAMEGPALMPE
jgi:NAD(P)-dependent dehydrogenase (short-subunit alcohol dehydrogenase family)